MIDSDRLDSLNVNHRGFFRHGALPKRPLLERRSVDLKRTFLPFLRNVVVSIDRLHGARRDTGAAIDAHLRIDVELRILVVSG